MHANQWIPWRAHFSLTRVHWFRDTFPRHFPGAFCKFTRCIISTDKRPAFCLDCVACHGFSFAPPGCRHHESHTRHRCHRCKAVAALTCAHEVSWDDAWPSPFGHARVHPRHTGGTTHPYYTDVFLLIFDADKDVVMNVVAPFGLDGARNNNATNMEWTTRMSETSVRVTNPG